MKPSHWHAALILLFAGVLVAAYLAAAPADTAGGVASVSQPSTQGARNQAAAKPDAEDVKKIAAICTIYDPWYHADVIVTKFLAGFPTDDGLITAKVKIVSLYLDQSEPDDLGHNLAGHYGIPIYPTIEGALTLGGEELAVDGVLLIGEHGQYPRNRYGQEMYPRMLMMKEVLRVFEYSDRVVPVWYDKHLSYNWLDAKWVYDRTKELGVPIMGGSVIPLIWREPAGFEHPIGVKIDEAVVVIYGELDRYGFHGLEMLQCMLERRAGGETGVKSVECVQGDAFHQAAKAGRIPMDLVATVLKERADIDMPKRPIKDNVKDPLAIIIDYIDGTHAAVLQLNKYYGPRWFYAAKVDGEVQTCEFIYLAPPDYKYRKSSPAFSYLGLNEQQMFLTGRPQTPIERTLLTSGITSTAVRSRHDGKPIKTPYLAINYKPYDFAPIRPSGSVPAGASLDPWPPENIKHLFHYKW